MSKQRNPAAVCGNCPYWREMTGSQEKGVCYFSPPSTDESRRSSYSRAQVAQLRRDRTRVGGVSMRVWAIVKKAQHHWEYDRCIAVLDVHRTKKDAAVFAKNMRFENYRVVPLDIPSAKEAAEGIEK